ncbi:MAG: RidA family protein [Thermoanaerobaculia bacterium]
MSGLRLGIVNPEELGAPRGFSHGIVAPAGCSLLFVAGQIGWNERQEIVEGGFAAQFERALENIRSVVRRAGGEVDRICRLTIYVTDKTEYESEIAAVGEAYRRVMGRHYPAMALLEVSGLLAPGARVEIEATAALSPKPSDSSLAGRAR